MSEPTHPPNMFGRDVWLARRAYVLDNLGRRPLKVKDVWKANEHLDKIDRQLDGL